jgi:uncharacterized protein YcgL (UPF0745 family)
MLASVYRSSKKDDMYLYLSVKDDFSKVPEALLKIFGKPEFSLQLNLANRAKLSRVDIDEVRSKLTDEGYFLQMPPVIHTNQANV